MIDWATIKPAIASQISTLTGLATNRVRWIDEPSGTLAGALPVIWLRVSSVVNVGIDRELRADNGTGEQTVTVIGQREFTLSIRIESYTPDITDANCSLNLANAIKTRMKRSTSVFARAGEYAIRQHLSTKWLSYIESNRPVSCHIVDLLCITADYDVDTTTGAGDWIGEVQGSGTIKNQDGTTIDTPAFDANYTTPPKYNKP